MHVRVGIIYVREKLNWKHQYSSFHDTPVHRSLVWTLKPHTYYALNQ